MKKSIKISLLLTFILAMLYSESADARIIYTYQRSGGIFGLFGTVNDTYNGQDQWGNELHTLSCQNPGTTRCRKGSINGGGSQMELEAFAAPFILSTEENAEDEVSTGNFSGSSYEKIAWDKNGDGSYDALVIIEANWESDDPEFNEGTLIISINEVEYP